jgi:hypothetical protein
LLAEGELEVDADELPLGIASAVIEDSVLRFDESIHRHLVLTWKTLPAPRPTGMESGERNILLLRRSMKLQPKFMWQLSHIRAG